MPNLQLIETLYKGVRFRSRLEARWAVMFDLLGAKWLYEPEGFKLPLTGAYLPDFKIELHGVSFWVEIKPSYELATSLGASPKIVEFAYHLEDRDKFLVIVGDPQENQIFTFFWVYTPETKRRILVLDAMTYLSSKKNFRYSGNGCHMYTDDLSSDCGTFDWFFHHNEYWNIDEYRTHQFWKEYQKALEKVNSYRFDRNGY